MTSNVDNVTNLLSKHDGVTLNLHTKETRIKPQFEERRNYQEVTYSNLMNELDENKNTKIQEMFQTTDTEEISEIYLEEMNKAVKKYLKITKIQKRKYQEKYWNKNLEAERQKINFWSKRF